METPMKIICPHCNQPSEHVKRAQTWLFVFILFGYYLRRTTVIGCRECLREKIINNALINVITANVLWPVIILPMSLYQYYRMSQDGHDEALLEEVRMRSMVLSQEKAKRG